MRLIKMLGLSTAAAVATMAFVGAGTASASKPTQLCNVQHSGVGETCSSPTTSIHLINSGVFFLLSDLIDILCLHVLMTAAVGALANAGVRQTITPSVFLFGSCGSNSTHSNCTITISQVPSLRLLKTALNLGNVTLQGGTIRIQCTIVPLPAIDCTYGFNPGVENPVEGALHTAGAGHGMVTFVKASTELVSGGFLCPDGGDLHGLLEPLSHIFIAS